MVDQHLDGHGAWGTGWAGRPGRSVRDEPVWPLLCAALEDRGQALGTRTLDILDAGGGTGNVAVPLAELGHRVTVVDPSLDSLAALDRRATQAGVTEGVRGIQGDAAGLLDVVPPRSVDAVVCHHVLEFVDDPVQALEAVGRTMRPGAVLSVLAANRHAVVLAKAAAGHVEDARRALADPVGRWGPEDPLPRRFTLSQLERLLSDLGFTVVASHGLHAFRELVPTQMSDDAGSADALAALEAAAAEHPAFRVVASQLHVRARWGGVA